MPKEEHVRLAPETTFRLGGDARFFVRVTKEEEIPDLVSFVKKEKLPLFVLGGGSNLLISDSGFPGLVLKNEIQGVSFTQEDVDVAVIVGAGVSWDELVAQTTEEGLWGMENLSLIPGTVGGAVVQNIGAYGVEVAETIESVRAYDIEKEEWKVFSHTECQFGYRQSIFKNHPNRYIVVSVTFLLSKNGIPNRTHASLVSYSDIDFLTPGIARETICKIRRSRLPDVKIIGTAGSFFKNPTLTEDAYNALIKKVGNTISAYKSGDLYKVSAGELLDKVGGFKGVKRGHVGTHETHALVLTHDGEGTSCDLYNLAKEMHNVVYEKTGVSLEPEAVFVGNFDCV